MRNADRIPREDRNVPGILLRKNREAAGNRQLDRKGFQHVHLTAMEILENIRLRAKKKLQKMVFPEGDDPRVIQAAFAIQKDELAVPILLGKPEVIVDYAQKNQLGSPPFEIINPPDSPLLDQFTELFFERRKHKGISLDSAKEYVRDQAAFGAMMLSSGRCDGYVAGAVRTTGDTVKAGIWCVGLKPGISVVSSFFLMVFPDSTWGENGSMLYADCGVVPDPTPEQLADIAISTAENARIYLKTEPRVALLSFSTKGSADHPLVHKVQKAFSILKDRNVDFEYDGELQGDAAIIPGVAKKKAPGSPLAGKANTLIFPNLDAGNIAYKLTQRLAGAQALGPILQGMAKPLNDLSRGCSVEDIINVAAITSLQAAEGKKDNG